MEKGGGVLSSLLLSLRGSPFFNVCAARASPTLITSNTVREVFGLRNLRWGVHRLAIVEREFPPVKPIGPSVSNGVKVRFAGVGAITLAVWTDGGEHDFSNEVDTGYKLGKETRSSLSY